MSIETSSRTEECHELTQDQWKKLDHLVDTLGVSYDEGRRMLGLDNYATIVSAPFDKRNESIVEATKAAGRLGRTVGLLKRMDELSYRGKPGDVLRKSSSALRRSIAEIAAMACDLCPLRRDCGVAGQLGDMLLDGKINYKKLRTAVSRTPGGRERSGWGGRCEDNGGVER